MGLLKKITGVQTAKAVVSVSQDSQDDPDSADLNISKLAAEQKTKARFARKKKYAPLVWLLSPASKETAQWLATKDLDSSIKNGTQVLVCVQLWLSGIRTPRTFRYLFPVITKNDSDKHEKSDTIRENAEKYFPGLLDDCPRFKFKYTFAKHSTVKWTRMCKENFAFLAENLLVMVQEWNYRFPKKRHCLENVVYLLTAEIDVSSLPNLPQGAIVMPDWRQIPPKYRMKNMFESYQRYYSICMENAAEAYFDSPRQIPDFIAKPRIAFD